MDNSLIERLIRDFYNAYYTNDRGRFYSMLSDSFRKRVSLDEFNQRRQYALIDLGKLKDIDSIEKTDQEIKAKCQVLIRQDLVNHTFTILKEDGQYFIKPDNFMFAK